MDIESLPVDPRQLVVATGRSSLPRARLRRGSGSNRSFEQCTPVPAEAHHTWGSGRVSPPRSCPAKPIRPAPDSDRLALFQGRVDRWRSLRRGRSTLARLPALPEHLWSTQGGGTFPLDVTRLKEDRMKAYILFLELAAAGVLFLVRAGAGTSSVNARNARPMTCASRGRRPRAPSATGPTARRSRRSSARGLPVPIPTRPSLGALREARRGSTARRVELRSRPAGPRPGRGHGNRRSESSELELDLGEAHLDGGAVDVAEALGEELAAGALEDRGEDLELALEVVGRRDEVREGALQVLRGDLARVGGLGLEDRRAPGPPRGPSPSSP